LSRTIVETADSIANRTPGFADQIEAPQRPHHLSKGNKTVNSLTSTARRYAAIAFPVALAAFATAVWAQPEPPAPNAGTLICRPALASETATAKMVATPTLLVCKPIAVSMHMSDGSMKTIGSVTAKPMSAPDFSQALTPQQATEAYNHWIEKALDIDPSRSSP
jgi:hypothetical protein